MRKILFLFLILVVVFSSQIFAAEDTQQERTNAEEDEKTKELEAISAPKPVKEKIAIKYGTWLSSTFRQYKNTDNDNTVPDKLKNSLEQDLRFWMWMTYLKKYSVYLRFRETYIRRSTSTGYTGIKDDAEGPYLDMGYLATNLEFGDIAVNTKLGRQFLLLGRGISFSGVHDGIELILKPPKFYVKGLFAHSNPKDNNLDQSVPEYDKKEERLYLGLEATYTSFYPTIFYIYGFAQRDKQDDHPAGTAQRYQYNSEYLGLGVDKQAKRGFSYWAEFIKEWGRSFNDTTYVDPHRSKIDAWALDVGTRYIFTLPALPTFEAEYALASGDPDRTDVTDTKPGGNQFGRDNNFSYYGYFGTGYALAARLSNLEMLKLQVGLTPVKDAKFAKSVDIGAKFYFYRKNRAEGPIYDTQATESNNDVGKEVNLFLYWQPNDNFYLNIKYGVFYPGDAFPETTNSNTQYFSTRATLKF
ncbi:MAG: hypothetical protein FJZ10_06730 [Candidatus Omnitrophica bacterium]|nr:hypothetical protein [Candidatus Omnitrophota bacterium]